MKRFYHRFWTLQSFLALTIILFFVAIAVAAPLISPAPDPANPTAFKVIAGRTDRNPLPPGPDAPLGTAVVFVPGLESRTLHFDILHSLIWGTRSVLRFGLVASLCTTLVGIIIGAISGYVGGRFGQLVMRVADSFLSFPLFAGVWLFRTIMHLVDLQYFDYSSYTMITLPPSPAQRLVLALGLDPLLLALILFAWVPSARLMNATVGRLREAEYVLAARSVGVGRLRIILRHLIPNAISPAIVLWARDVGNLVVLQAAFAYIGMLGSTESNTIPEWDRLLMLGKDWVIGISGNPFRYWWMYLPVTLALIFFGVAWNLLGDSLNTALNPRETGTHMAEGPAAPRRRWWGKRRDGEPANRRGGEPGLKRLSD